MTPVCPSATPVTVPSVATVAMVAFCDWDCTAGDTPGSACTVGTSFTLAFWRMLAGDGVTLVMRTVPVTVTGRVTLLVGSAVDVAVMIVVPAPTPVTVPVRPSVDVTVADVGLLDVNVTVRASVPRVSTVAATWKFWPTRIACAGRLSVMPTTRGGLTVMVTLPVLLRLAVDVAVMVVWPPATPVTRPDGLTVATLGALDVQSTLCDAPFWTSTFTLSCTVPVMSIGFVPGGETVTAMTTGALTIPGPSPPPPPQPAARPASAKTNW